MTASQETKAAGLKGGVAEMSRLSGIPVRTLGDWFHGKHQAFHVMLIGCVTIVNNCENNQET